MNTKDLTILAVGVGIVLVAYFMKKKGVEGFQLANVVTPTAVAQPPPGMMPPAGMQPPSTMMPPPIPGIPSIPSSSVTPPSTMMPLPPAPNFFSGTPPMATVPAIGPTTAPMTAPAASAGSQPTQPMPLGMQPNQEQIIDIANKVNKMNNEQAAIMAQIQQMTKALTPPSTEGFQSYHNPYDNHSPGDTQAMEFRLGKKAMADSVVRY